ncbi:Omp85 domain-containing protein [Chitinophaga sp. 180180018-2]|nr:Omp85 domain-containing protein [Chitinophaga sp. 212800010-3]
MNYRKIWPTITVLCWLICLHMEVFAQVPLAADTVPTHPHRSGLFKMIGEYRDSIRNKEYRQSLIRRITRQNETVESNDNDSTIIKSEAYFTPFAGKVIRNINYRKVKVFGPSNINDTTFTTSMKMIHLANRLHYDSREWVIRQSLFFRENDRLNPFEMADNERYLRNRPFIQDARLYIKNEVGDSIDVEVVTKDLFEYGADLSQFSAKDIRASVSNNDLFGAGEGLRFGFQWRSDFSPTWNTEVRYTKYNLLGSFVDVALGYTTLNNYAQLDTNSYEGAVYINFTRPLYRNSAKWVGGLALSQNWSINIRGAVPQPDDSTYRDYKYRIIDGWIGYNFINHYNSNGTTGRKPNLALLARHYNLYFQRKPDQLRYKDDPIYNNHRLYLLQLQAYQVDYFKAHYFFGFGRTEDIPLGYNVSATGGWESWKGRRRMYSGLEAQKYWTTKNQGLFSTSVGVSTYWLHNATEDAVMHARVEYYSRLLTFRKSRFRQFINLDYLNSPNPFFNKPLNINMEYGIWGYRNTLLNGFQRLNMSSETVYYSPLKIMGFKFNFFTSLQASMLNYKHDDLLQNPIKLGLGGGFRVRNENLALNTIKVSGYYYPDAPPPMKGFLLEITTIVDFRFDVSPLKMPSVILFR